jgi:hypothetical protein
MGCEEWRVQSGEWRADYGTLVRYASYDAIVLWSRVEQSKATVGKGEEIAGASDCSRSQL